MNRGYRILVNIIGSLGQNKKIFFYSSLAANYSGYYSSFLPKRFERSPARRGEAKLSFRDPAKKYASVAQW